MTEAENNKKFKSGYICIMGKPNVGKSTLLNNIIGEKLAAVTPKAHTTRQQFLGIVNGNNYQMIFVDTPGIVIKPSHELHKKMNTSISEAKQDADILFFMFEAKKFNPDNWSEKMLRKDIPKAVIINKIDLSNQNQMQEEIKAYEEIFPNTPIFCISALHQNHLGQILRFVQENLPVHPPYFEQDAITDRTERFIISEIIREQIFVLFKNEIPYCCEVAVSQFKEEGNLCKIEAIIYAERESQKGILIGKGGVKLKQISIKTRQIIEPFLEKKVFLRFDVKIEPNWRKRNDKLSEFGY